jgi:3D (Asp-Asp-Asp) domain-containing protein
MRFAATLLGGLTVAVATGAAGETMQPNRPLKPGDIVEVSATAYCLEGETKAGTETRRGIVAADPGVLPLGTVIRVDGLADRHNRRYVVEDTGRAIKGREIDIYMPSCDAAKDFGRRDARARVIRVGKRTR